MRLIIESALYLYLTTEILFVPDDWNLGDALIVGNNIAKISFMPLGSVHIPMVLVTRVEVTPSVLARVAQRPFLWKRCWVILNFQCNGFYWTACRIVDKFMETFDSFHLFSGQSEFLKWEKIYVQFFLLWQKSPFFGFDDWFASWVVLLKSLVMELWWVGNIGVMHYISLKILVRALNFHSSWLYH